MQTAVHCAAVTEYTATGTAISSSPERIQSLIIYTFAVSTFTIAVPTTFVHVLFVAWPVSPETKLTLVIASRLLIRMPATACALLQWVRLAIVHLTISTTMTSTTCAASTRTPPTYLVRELRAGAAGVLVRISGDIELWNLPFGESTMLEMDRARLFHFTATSGPTDSLQTPRTPVN